MGLAGLGFSCARCGVLGWRLVTSPAANKGTTTTATSSSPPRRQCVCDKHSLWCLFGFGGCLPISFFFHLQERLGEEGNGFGEGKCDCCDSVTRGCSVAGTALVRARCEALRHPRDTTCLLVFVAAGPSFVHIGPTRKTKQHCGRIFLFFFFYPRFFLENMGIGIFFFFFFLRSASHFFLFPTFHC